MNLWIKNDFEISTDNARLDIDMICRFLKEESYWANDRSPSQVIDSIKNSLCFGLYEKGTPIGFARVVTDYATFGWLADVFILKSHQGKGLGKWLIEVIFNHDSLKNVVSWLLLTNDAQGLYEKVGFAEYPYPQRVMMRDAKPG